MKASLASAACLVAAILTSCGNGSATAASSGPDTAPNSSSPAIPLPRCPNPEGGTCLGRLSSGTYQTTEFRPPITYKVPSGWGNYEDLVGNFLLIPPGFHLAGVDPGKSDYIGVYSRVAAGCEPPAAGVARSPRAIAGWIAHQQSLQASSPRSVAVGGLHGIILDVKLAKGADGACLITGVDYSSLAHGLIPGLTIRLYLLRHGGTLAIEVDDVRGGGKHLDAYSSVVKGLHFES